MNDTSAPVSSDGPKIWLITGCSTGLGRSLAERAVAAGDRVIATARSMDRISDLVRLAPDSVVALELDLTRPDQIRSAVATAHAAWGRLDVVVNNAGYGLMGALEEYTEDQIEKNLEVNLMGPIRVIRAALPFLRSQRSGHLIQISAAAAISNYAGFSVYGGSKWALEGVSEALREELRPLGIQVTLAEPGPFRTDFIGRSLVKGTNPLPDYDQTSGRFAQLLQRIDGRQPGDPQRAARILVEMVHAGRAPMRVVLGRYAVEKTRKMLRTRESELAEWSGIAVDADFPA